MQLYKSGRWLVTADISAGGDLSIISGPSNAEWHVNVKADDMSALHARLSNDLGRSVSTTAQDTDVLTLLSDKFGHSASSPFDDIKQYLSGQGIPYDTSFWGEI